MKQKIFNYNLSPKSNIDDFYVSNSNSKAYKYVLDDNSLIKQCIIYGPHKSGKTHLGSIWKNINNAILYNDNYEFILNSNKNILIDDVSKINNDECLFHIINHCSNNNLKILLTSQNLLSNLNINLPDLSSRLKSFHFIEILNPDDQLIVNLIIKLLHDKQIIINNAEIIDYIIKRINRSYNDIHLFIENVDKLSLEKKRQLTIPLIRELL